MWPFRTKRLLRYPSIEAWLQGEVLTAPIIKIADPVERDRRLTEYEELRRHLFAQHVKTLSADEQREFAAGTHPSQSHRFADRAERFGPLLREHLAYLGFMGSVVLGAYHLDRLVLSANLDEDPVDRQRELPWLFRGFEVLYHWPHGGG